MKNTFKILAIVTLIFVTSCGKDKTKITDNREAVPVQVITPTSQN